MATTILERRPNTSVDLVDFWTLLAFASSKAIKKRYGVAPRLADRLEAACQLADRLHGRAVQAVEIDDRPHVPAFTLPEGTTGVDVI
jgi:hypothetical protein